MGAPPELLRTWKKCFSLGLFLVKIHSSAMEQKYFFLSQNLETERRRLSQEMGLRDDSEHLLSPSTFGDRLLKLDCWAGLFKLPVVCRTEQTTPSVQGNVSLNTAFVGFT